MVVKTHFKGVEKRDGSIVPFNQEKITNAVMRALKETQEGNLERDPFLVSDLVAKQLMKRYPPNYVPNIEQIQDTVERVLILKDFPKTAKAYILYRQERARLRDTKKSVPEKIKRLVEESKKYFKNPLSEFVYFRTYSRWLKEEQRRETWVETVDRYISFMRENIKSRLTEEEYDKIRQAVLKQEVMPSMRLMWAAGEAARNTNVSAYNCSYIAPSKITDFAEIMYVLMCGSGVGFSVESQTSQQLPIIRRQTGQKLSTHVVEDSKEGWGRALTAGLNAWYEGKDIDFDYSKVRPAGARLKTMGGRASGPEPLKLLLEFSKERILAKQGKRLSNIDVHDIVCKIGEIVVAGGVRRSALISLSDIDDKEMREAKKGQFWLQNPQRSMANNSAVYNQRPGANEFLEEWLSLIKSGTGERGIFNRDGLKTQLPERRQKLFQKHFQSSGSNPCGEIILRSKQFCNLTEVVARPEDTEETLLDKVEKATILGTYQSTLTNFPFISKEWKKNCEEERLLGVSLTGQWDCPILRNPGTLKKLKAKAIEVNKIYARRFNINASTALTCVKPSGTVSQLVDASAGMHPRYAPYYIRRIRISATDPLFQMLREQKFPYYPEVGQLMHIANTYVLEFPVKAPESAVFRKDIDALEQLEYWKMVKKNYTEHNPSVTVNVGKDEWVQVANWIYNEWNIIGGLAFLPKEDHLYSLAPYEEITKEEYEEMLAKFPEIDFSQIILYEKQDETTGAKELACTSGTCDIDVDVSTLKKEEKEEAVS